MASALFDCHLKIGDIKGESKHKDHSGEITIESFNLGVEQQGTAHHSGGQGAGKAQLHDAQMVAKTDKAVPFLFLASANGTHYDTAVLTCRKAGGTQEKFLEITFKELMISHVNLSAHTSGDVIPTTTFALNYAEISVEYFAQDEKGKTTSSGKKTFNARTTKSS